MNGCCACDFSNEIGKMAAQVAYLRLHPDQLDGNYLNNKKDTFQLKRIQWKTSKGSVLYSPNLSRTDGPVGGGCVIIGLFVSYFDVGYETV